MCGEDLFEGSQPRANESHLFDTASKEIPPTDLFGLSRHSQLTEFAGSPEYPDRPFTYSVDLRRYVHAWGTAVGRSWSNNTRMW